MGRGSAWIALAAAAAMATPARAGGSHKCTKATQECLDAIATAVRSKGWAGLELDTSKTGAMSVKAVVPGSPAEAAGFAAGDVLIALNGIKFADEKSKDALYALKKTLVPGARATYTIQRAGSEQRIGVTLAPMPDSVRAAYVGEHMLEHARPRTADK